MHVNNTITTSPGIVSDILQNSAACSSVTSGGSKLYLPLSDSEQEPFYLWEVALVDPIDLVGALELYKKSFWGKNQLFHVFKPI